MSRESKFVKNIFILAIGTFLPKLATFITLPVLTGFLTKEEYGTYDLVTILVSLVLPVATFQIQTAAFRFMIDVSHDEKEVKKIISTIFTFIIPVSVLTLAVMYFCLYKISNPARLWVCGYFFADIVVNAARQVTRGMHRNMDYSLSAAISATGKIVFAFLFVKVFHMGLSGAVMALCLASTCSLIFIVLKVKLYRMFDFSLVDKKTFKELINYSWPMIPNSMSMWVMRVSDRFVVTAFMGVTANAVYSVANKIPSMLSLAQTTFTMAWQENASIVSKDDDADAYYTSMFKTIFNVMAGFMGLIIGFAPVLFMILIKGDYSEAYVQMPLLFIGMFFYSLASFFGGIYVAYKKTKSVGITTMIAAAINILIDLATIKWLGLYAASLSTLISYVVLFTYRMFDVRKFVKMKYDYKYIIIVLGVLCIQCWICLAQNFALNCVNAVLGTVFFVFLNIPLIKASFTKVKKMLKR